MKEEHHQQIHSPYSNLSDSNEDDSPVDRVVRFHGDGLPNSPSNSNSCLPDIDDMGMNCVFEYVEYYEQDLLWSILSDSFFIAGGISYTILTLWIAIVDPLEISNYYGLDVIAPAVYLCNSFVDMEWARRIAQRKRIKENVPGSWDECQRHLQTVSSGGASLEARCQVEIRSWNSWYQKHGAHRRSLLAAVTFGLAAASDVSAALLGYWRHDWGPFFTNLFQSFGVHFYVLSSLICVTGQRTRPWLVPSISDCAMWEDPEALADIGDLLFLAGSIMDASLIDFKVEEPSWGVVSSLFWLIDACLYLRSDFILARMARQKRRVVCHEMV